LAFRNIGQKRAEELNVRLYSKAQIDLPPWSPESALENVGEPSKKTPSLVGVLLSLRMQSTRADSVSDDPEYPFRYTLGSGQSVAAGETEFFPPIRISPHEVSSTNIACKIRVSYGAGNTASARFILIFE
jgi:hypothetical protein